MQAEQVVDALVKKAKLILPRAGLRKIGLGLYEAFGHCVQLELVTHLQGSAAEAAAAQAAGNPLVELVVVIGGKRILLADYAAGRMEGSTQVPVGGSAIHAVPEKDRVSFEEVFPATRAEAMHVALMEAQAREQLAKNKLELRAGVSKSLNSSFSLGSQASLTPKAGSWSLNASQVEEPGPPLSARSPPSHSRSLSQVVKVQSPPAGYRTMSPMPSAVPRAGSPLPASQMHVRAEIRADSRQRAYSPAPANTRIRASSTDERARSLSPAPQAPQSPRVVLQWQTSRNAYAPQNKQQHAWLLEERPGTRSVSPDNRRSAQSSMQSPLRMRSNPLASMPNSSPNLPMQRSQSPDVRQSQQQQASPPRFLSAQSPSRLLSLSTMHRDNGQSQSAPLSENPLLPMFPAQNSQSLSAESSMVLQRSPALDYGQEPHSPHPPARPVRRTTASPFQYTRDFLGASSASGGSWTSGGLPFPVPSAPPGSARKNYLEESPKQSVLQAFHSRSSSMSLPVHQPVHHQPRSSSMSLPVHQPGIDYKLQVPPHVQATGGSSRNSSASPVKMQGVQRLKGIAQEVAPQSLLSADVLAEAATMMTEEGSPEGPTVQQEEESMAPPASVASLKSEIQSGAARNGDQRNGGPKATLLWDAEFSSDSQLSYELTKKRRAFSLSLPTREQLDGTQRNAYAFGARGNAQYEGVSPELLNAKLLSLRAGMINRDRTQHFSPGMSRNTSSSSSSQRLDSQGEPGQGEQVRLDTAREAGAKAAPMSEKRLSWELWKPTLGDFQGELADLRRQLAESLPSASYPQTDAASETGSEVELPWTLWQANTELRGELAQLRQKLVEAKSRSQEAMTAIKVLHAVRQVEAKARAP